MFLSARARRLCVLLICQLLMVAILASTGLAAWAQDEPQQGPEKGGGITTEICVPPPVCFGSEQAKQQWAEQNNCRFIEDVCGGEEHVRQPGQYDGWLGPGKFAGEFGVGLAAGVGQQLKDIFQIFSHPVETALGLAQLVKSLFQNPLATIEALGDALGDEFVKTLEQVTHCDAYTMGKKLGEYLNPAMVAGVAVKIVRLGGKGATLARIREAAQWAKACASFTADTLVQTPGALLPIQDITVGSLVLSRSERDWTESPQNVLKTFKRTAPGYRELVTETQTYRLTDEHPVWVQGYGWKQAKDVQEDEIVSELVGDALVLDNRPVDEPVQVFNFEVEASPNYFVGETGLWVHNARCDLPRRDLKPSKKPAKYGNGEGLSGNNWKFNPAKDVDMRGGASYRDAIDEAARRLGVSRDELVPTKWGYTPDGKTIPVEYQVPGGSINLDIPEVNGRIVNGKIVSEGPLQPHIGYRGKGGNRGHIFVDEVPATRGPLGE